MNPINGSPIDHEFPPYETAYPSSALAPWHPAIVLQENDQRSLEAGYFTPADFDEGGEA